MAVFSTYIHQEKIWDRCTDFVFWCLMDQMIMNYMTIHGQYAHVSWLLMVLFMDDIRNEVNEAHNPADLVCGACSAAAGGYGLCKKGHGKEYIEFKCRFCCSPATYFCFGRTHFCDSCHVTRPDMQKDIVLNQCKGPKWCPLRIPHLPNGEECCLGCSMCRFDNQWHRCLSPLFFMKDIGAGEYLVRVRTSYTLTKSSSCTIGHESHYICEPTLYT